MNELDFDDMYEVFEEDDIMAAIKYLDDHDTMPLEQRFEQAQQAKMQLLEALANFYLNPLPGYILARMELARN